MVVWDVLTASELGSLPAATSADDSGVVWSYNGDYLARAVTDAASGADMVEVYVLPTLEVLDKRPIRAPGGARGLCWAPAKYAPSSSFFVELLCLRSCSCTRSCPCSCSRSYSCSCSRLCSCSRSCSYSCVRVPVRARVPVVSHRFGSGLACEHQRPTS